MATINVNRNLSDQFYRYKMPKLLAKVEGKGNGIKTVIVNMVEIAKSLNRPPMCKYRAPNSMFLDSFVLIRSNQVFWLRVGCPSQL